MKKGSLSLSVNAIVVLILAITMLGLGLGFMKGMFGKMTERFDTASGAGDLTNPPSSSNPFTVSSNQLSVSRGTTTSVQVAWLNDLIAPASPDPNIVCEDQLAADPIGGGRLFVIGLNARNNIEQNKIASWNVGVQVDETALVGDVYACSIDDAQVPPKYVDFIVTVK
ncbi:hypothetical protein J4227_04790 [Candidatus Woesearchaeota archaeon]|nr:hypothetical protein [Candidatus Woesearchaeota archaeon]